MPRHISLDRHRTRHRGIRDVRDENGRNFILANLHLRFDHRLWNAQHDWGHDVLPVSVSFRHIGGVARYIQETSKQVSYHSSICTSQERCQ